MSLDNKYYSTDIIAHYTSLDNAIKILEANRLRLSLRSDSYDCIERMFGHDAYLTRSQERENYDYAKSSEVHQVTRQIVEFYKGIKQACFCKTIRTNQYRKSIDDLSFLHTRMWEQYASCYKGICLLFSIEKIKCANPDCIFGDMQYKPLSFLTSIRLDEGIDIDQLRELGVEEYVPIRKKQIIEMAFEKSSEYREENEFRIMKLDCDCDHNDFIDISDSLVSVVYFPEYSRQRMYEEECKDKSCDYKTCKYKSFICKQMDFIKKSSEKQIEVLRLKPNVTGSISFETEEEHKFIESELESFIHSKELNIKC